MNRFALLSLLVLNCAVAMENTSDETESEAMSINSQCAEIKALMIVCQEKLNKIVNIPLPKKIVKKNSLLKHCQECNIDILEKNFSKHIRYVHQFQKPFICTNRKCHQKFTRRANRDNHSIYKCRYRKDEE
jgi:hypothetical protein